MNFEESLKFLKIEDYGQQIFHSNSHGELFHCYDYIHLADHFKPHPDWFRPLFLMCVKFAEENWKRPESCFQHMPKLMYEMVRNSLTVD